ncbi:MAG: GTPase ObgE [Alphaproteobacteria bacterium]|nr:GTPase ObgE [Alphaproteobacteria bacterium]MCB1551069.1 GTPase ObgE [Alphaproteobacteria bacterium]MCB9984805.1 GTPase ObgE [Micavibrio sp.]HRK97196.1 GTPase ObgE [Alphaproteobacteria bacterium]
MKFLDEAKIYMKSGDGGAGCCSFHREKYIEFGGPDGGNGGKGGDVIIECAQDLNTLIDFRYAQHFKGEKGHHGMGRNRSGAHGKDTIIRVPVGTEILDEDKETVLADMTRPGLRRVFLKGGDGGFGNAHYKSPTNQAPRKFTNGWPGQEISVWLRLKLIADAGIIGMPNAGKSTFLAANSAAKPKIADYPFTTLHPNLGVVKIEDYDFVLADIPGLIEGASEGVGLGTRFLGHVERTAVLLHMIDITQENPLESYHIIRNELEEYGANLEDKNELIVLNKIDSVDKETMTSIADQFEQELGARPWLISGVTGEGLRPLLFKLVEIIKEEKEARNKDEKESDSIKLYDPTATA